MRVTYDYRHFLTGYRWRANRTDQSDLHLDSGYFSRHECSPKGGHRTRRDPDGCYGSLCEFPVHVDGLAAEGLQDLGQAESRHWVDRVCSQQHDQPGNPQGRDAARRAADSDDDGEDRHRRSGRRGHRGSRQCAGRPVSAYRGFELRECWGWGHSRDRCALISTLDSTTSVVEIFLSEDLDLFLTDKVVECLSATPLYTTSCDVLAATARQVFLALIDLGVVSYPLVQPVRYKLAREIEDFNSLEGWQNAAFPL